jgi:aminoglycoside phosphotransferase (APT) family kinase protein
LYSKERSTLLDWDSLACGDPAQDCGNFMGHLVLRQLQEPANVLNIDKGIKAFRSAYEYADDKFEVRVKWWQAATLLRLGFLYSLRPKWHRLTGSLLKMAISNVDLNQTQKEGVNENYRS